MNDEQWKIFAKAGRSAGAPRVWFPRSQFLDATTADVAGHGHDLGQPAAALVAQSRKEKLHLGLHRTLRHSLESSRRFNDEDPDIPDWLTAAECAARKPVSPFGRCQLYEECGLIAPARSAGGWHRYGPHRPRQAQHHHAAQGGGHEPRPDSRHVTHSGMKAPTLREILEIQLDTWKARHDRKPSEGRRSSRRRWSTSRAIARSRSTSSVISSGAFR